MTDQAEPRPPREHLPGLITPSALLLCALVAMDSNAASLPHAPQGHYHSSGQVLLSDGSLLPISKSLVLEEHRFLSVIRSSTVMIESTGRVETDFFGRARLLLEQRHVSGLSAELRVDDQLMFNLLYGRHRGAQLNLEQVGECLYGIETRQVYCPVDHPQRNSR